MNAISVLSDLLHRLVSLMQKAVRTFLILLVRGYQFFISPYFPTSCRYYPTCSHYALEAIKIHGAFKGTGLAAWRILRCHPWSAGGEDPVPAKKSSCTCEYHGNERHGNTTQKEFRQNPVPFTTSNDL